jgi:hypothetical protein
MSENTRKFPSKVEPKWRVECGLCPWTVLADSQAQAEAVLEMHAVTDHAGWDREAKTVVGDKAGRAGEPVADQGDGGPAFPFVVDDDKQEHTTVEWGMSLRDYFAAAALQGMLSNVDLAPSHAEKELATRACYIIWADAMLEARKEKSKKGVDRGGKVG